MKYLILFSLIISSISFATVKDLGTWTYSSNSVQAVIYESLEIAARLDSQSRYPTNNIVRNNSALTIQTHEALLSCEAKTLGMAMVMSYRCVVKGNISSWTNDASSVQAVLYEALATALNEDEQSRYPSKVIVRKNSALVVDDGTSAVSCEAGTKGVAQVQNYACVIK